LRGHCTDVTKITVLVIAVDELAIAATVLDRSAAVTIGAPF
jgi:hypothetical protein